MTELLKLLESNKNGSGLPAQGGNDIPLNQIEANPNQPRRDFDPDALQELEQLATL